MNSAHEPGSRIMSKNRLKNNTESIRIENRPSAPSAQPVASPRAQAARPAPRPRACRPASPAPRAPHAPAPAAARLPRPRPTRLPAARRCRGPACYLRAQPRAQRLPSAHASCHNTALLYCDTIWPSLSCNTPQPTKLYCNTIS